jgi:hypothetical protein
VGAAWCLWLTPGILATQEAQVRRIEVESQPGQIVPENLPRKYLSQKRAAVAAQVVDGLPSKREEVSSNPSSTVNG